MPINNRAISLVLVVATVIVAAPARLQAQDNEENWVVPRTEYGHPDLQGTWNFGSSTPLVRPAELGDKRFYTEQEAKDRLAELRQQDALRDDPLDADRPAPPRGAPVGQEAEMDYMTRDIKIERIDGEYRTSLIIDPPDGQLPLNTEFEDYFARLLRDGSSSYSGPDTMGSTERCLMYALAVPTLFPMPWNAHLQIVQNRDYVMLMTEMIHDARIVRLDAVHRDDDIRLWMGDSVGHWEGDTLVVQTRQFRPEQSMSGMLPMSEEFHLTERFTPLSQEEILYRYTIDDPRAFTQSVTVERTIRRTAPETRLYEFACHEGNYSMAYSLTGARIDDLKQESLANEIRNEHLPAEVIERLAGHWRGEVNGADLLLKFTPGNRGGMLAFLDIANRGLTNLEVLQIEVAEEAISFAVNGVGAKFEGRIEQAALTGTWSRMDYALPLQLDRTESESESAGY